MASIVIHGRLDATPSVSDVAKSLPGQVTPKYSAQPQAARAGAAAHRLDVAEDDIVELELDGGVRLWQRADTLLRDFPGSAKRGAADGYELPPVLALGRARRGVGAWVIKGLNVFGVDLAGDIKDIVSAKVEGALKPGGPGLYRCSPAGATDLHAVGALDARKPMLIMIHGTASSTDGSFGGLWEGGASSCYAKLDKAYNGQVLAFQHRTLTQSPIENAVELASKLPDSARLHLISHSRGGVVGELLCRAMLKSRSPFDKSDLALFSEPDRKRDLEALTALRKLLVDKKFRIERFVRTACPARGTTLVDGRLDRYLSIVVNALGQIPGFKFNPIYDATSALLLAVLKKRTLPQELPGLEAMMPSSPLIRVLNRPGQTTDADLHVVGGNISGDSTWSSLKALVADLYYGEDNDLVVNTPSMFGGAERTGGVRYWIDAGGGVDHFHYFRNADTANRVVATLVRRDSAAHAGGPAIAPADSEMFHLLESKPSAVTPDDYRKRTIAPQPFVIVLPGIMGSMLKVNDNPVWMNYLALAAGGLADLDLSAVNVEPYALVSNSYQRLLRFLSQTHEVIPFPYDWRKTITDSAQHLQAVLEQTLTKAEAQNQPVRIVAHSMGGLVVRAMLADSDGQKLWRRMCTNPGARFIMLGTPNGGSHAIVSTMIGRDGLVKKLALLDIKHSYADLLNYISRFFGVLQLLPYKGTVDAYEMASWETLRTQDLVGQRGIGTSPVASSDSAGFAWPLPDPEQLAEARRIRNLIRSSPIDPDRMIYVAGRADATAIDITVDPDAPAGQRVAVIATADGDGRVPWATGIPPELGARTYYIDAVHGDLADVPDAFPALLDLLTVGATTKLSTTPPSRRGAAAETFTLPAEVPTMFPDEQDILCSALGSTRRDMAASPSAESKVRVRVVHGNLSGARNPVVMGHYEGDTIVSAEAYMDRQLSGRLREAQRLLLYPGPLNTIKLFLNDRELCRQGAHPGAIVIGLGTVGDLTSGALASTFANSVTTYALARVEEQRALHKLGAVVDQDDARLNIGLTSLVIGSGEAGLSIADALQAMLRGVREANLHLKELTSIQTSATPETGSRNRSVSALIDSIDFVELWEDRAIRAAKALLRLGMSAEVRSAFAVEELIVEGRDGQRRVDFDEEPNWWQRVRISTQADGALKFETFGDRARSESWLQPTQRKLVGSFLEQATQSTLTDPNVSFTMFELLVPNTLKQAAPDRRNLALVLDEESAAYPWELLQNRYEDGSAPLSVQAGMLRQLVLPEFRSKVVHATDLSALVIGDPTSSDGSPDFPALPGAAAEARAVAKRLRDGGYRQVVELVEADATPTATLNALYARPYRILHLAGHGAFEYPIYSDETQNNGDEAPKTVTGMVLGKSIFLTPAEIEQMRTVPELVFINCCHLGEMTGESKQKSLPYHKLAANVAAQFIRMGVRAVIAAGWAVDDSAASTFATKFYDCMLAGVAFGDAVRTARNEVYRSGGGSNTWGAYQCYGDPDFSFGLPQRSTGSVDARVVAGSEMRRLADVISLRARTADSATTGRLIDELQSLASGSAQDWLASSANCAALASAYGELGMFEEALSYYEKSRSMHPADAKIESLEELVNLSGRWAVELFGDMLGPRAARASPEVRSKAKELLAKAEEILDGLLVIGKTSERLSLKGSLYKRKAMIAADSKERHEILDQMAHHYDAAYELGVRAKRDDAYYALANRLAAEIVLSWSGSARKGLSKARKQRIAAIEHGLETVKSIADRAKLGSDFWSDTMRGNGLLGNCMARQEISGADLEQMRAIYSNAALRGGSVRWLRSVTDHIGFFQTMADAMADPAHKDALVESLKSLRESVTAVATKASP